MAYMIQHSSPYVLTSNPSVITVTIIISTKKKKNLIEAIWLEGNLL